MVNAIFKGLFKFLINTTKIFLLPVDLLVSNLFPDFTNMVSTFDSAVTQGYIGRGLAYFGSLLPPNCRVFIIMYLTISIGLYTISLAVHGIIKVIQIIKNIKIW